MITPTQIYLEMGIKAHVSGKLDTAKTYYESVLAIDPNSVPANGWLGTIEAQRKNFSRARLLLERALLGSNEPDFLLNYANLLQETNDYEQALLTYLKVIKKTRNPVSLSNLAACYNQLNQPGQALRYADQSLAIDQKYAEGWNTRGVALNALKRSEEALASYNRAIELKPDYAKAWRNRGVTLDQLRRQEEALASYNRAIELKPDYADAWADRGDALYSLRRREEALASYERAVELKPDIDFVLGALIYIQMNICDWTHLDQRYIALEKKLREGKASPPFPVLGLFDDPALQKRCAEIYTKDKLYFSSQLGVITEKPKRDIIRIGYFSMDFREHAVSYLIAELFEQHNRSKFEVYAFSFGVNSRDPMRHRVEKTVDRFLDVENLSDLDIIRLSRQLEIDIAIDLGGHTQGSRPQIFAERVAPIQINYLGYPGTWGSDCMDYFIGDKVTIPDESWGHFFEKIIYLPHSFQVNPSSRPIKNNKPYRQDHGLPNCSFVFCCFNNPWKITAEIFRQWIEILQQVPDSVLWLYADSSSQKNLKLTAAKHGISVDRVIFAKLVQRDEYMAQFQHADLFLDTLPYNAGTTASDAIWAGVPVLTQVGKSFVSRMAASLLTNIGVPELITYDKEEYCSLAVELALNPGKLAATRAKLVRNRLTAPLFNTGLFVKHIEAAYRAAYDRYHAGLPPDHINIGP